MVQILMNPAPGLPSASNTFNDENKVRKILDKANYVLQISSKVPLL